MAASTQIADKRGIRKTEVKGDGVTGFYVMMNGQIESGEFRGADNLFARYTFAYGADWRMLQGDGQGYSQVVSKGSSSDASIIWNYPVEALWKATNPQGWPRLVVSVYAQDMFGRFVVQGYGSVAVPTMPGRYVRRVRMFTPVASTLLQSFVGWLTGNVPEFYDSKFVAANEGREVTRVKATGTVTVHLNVMTRGMAAHGYTTGAPPDVIEGDAEGFLSPSAGLGVGAGGSAAARTGMPALPEAADRSRAADVMATTRRLLSASSALLEGKGGVGGDRPSPSNELSATLSSTAARTTPTFATTSASTLPALTAPIPSDTGVTATGTDLGATAAAAKKTTRRRIADRSADAAALVEGGDAAPVRSRSKHGRTGTVQSMFRADEETTVTAVNTAPVDQTPTRVRVHKELAGPDEDAPAAVKPPSGAKPTSDLPPLFSTSGTTPSRPTAARGEDDDEDVGIRIRRAQPKRPPPNLSPEAKSRD